MERMLNFADAKTTTKLLPHLAAFVAVVEAGSYSGAARRLGIDKTLLSRRVRTLEDGLGVRLLQRTTRRLSPTEAGRVLFESAMSPLNETVAALSRAADPGRVEGTVRIATFSVLTEQLWIPVIRKLREQHPELRLELRAAERFIDLVDEGIDFALRAGNMPDSTFTARRICTWHYVLCAAPSWVEQHGANVRTPEDIRDHWLLYGGVPRANRWTFERGDEKMEVQTGAAVVVDSGEVTERLLHAGLGVVAMPTYMAGAALASGTLVRLLPEWRVAHSHGLWIVTPARDHVPPRVTVVIEAVRAQLEALALEWERVPH
jgi:DNA-binding transcriptional LysR family regulator